VRADLETFTGMKYWPIFDIYVSLYFGNGTRYGHNYNGRRIETRIYAIYRMVTFSVTLMILSDLVIFLVHEPNGNLLTTNNRRTVDYYYDMHVLTVAMLT